MKPFADTNVLIYALVPDDERKQAIAQRLLAGLQGLRPVISTQTLAETYHVLTRRKAWKPADATKALRVLAELTVVVPSAESVLQGLELAARHKLSGWDALIVQAALQAGCDTLYSEDLQTGRRFGTLEVVDPFRLPCKKPRARSAPDQAAEPAVTAARPAGVASRIGRFTRAAPAARAMSIAQ